MSVKQSQQSMSHKVDYGQQEGQLDRVDSVYRPSSKRWIILVLYCLNSGNKAFQWLQLSTVTTQAALFYQVDNYVINFATTIFMYSFLIMSWPACFIIDKIGMRNTTLVSLLGSSMGATIKCFSCYSSNVFLLFLGEVIESLNAQLIYSMPSRLVAIWFPDHQVSLAVAICLLGGEFGNAFGFMVPQWFLGVAETKDEIGIGLNRLLSSTALFSWSLFLLNLIAFDEAPAHPPGEARAKQLELEQRIRSDGSDTLGKSIAENKVMILFGQILALLKNKDLMLVACLYGLGVGRSDAMSTLLDQTMRPLYPGNGSVVGTTGCLVIFVGAFGLPVWGRILDKWRAYKTVNILISVAASLALLCLTYATIYLRSVWLVYSTAILFGFFQSGFLVTALELAVELTYPAPELVTSSLLEIMASITGPVCILLGSYIVSTFGPLAVNMFHLSTVLVGLVCILCTKERLKRQAAVQVGKLRA